MFKTEFNEYTSEEDGKCYINFSITDSLNHQLEIIYPHQPIPETDIILQVVGPDKYSDERNAIVRLDGSSMIGIGPLYLGSMQHHPVSCDYEREILNNYDADIISLEPFNINKFSLGERRYIERVHPRSRTMISGLFFDIRIANYRESGTLRICVFDTGIDYLSPDKYLQKSVDIYASNLKNKTVKKYTI